MRHTLLLPTLLLFLGFVVGLNRPPNAKARNLADRADAPRPPRSSFRRIETNASRFARGLPPLSPKKRSGLMRRVASPVLVSGILQILDANRDVLGYMSGSYDYTSDPNAAMVVQVVNSGSYTDMKIMSGLYAGRFAAYAIEDDNRPSLTQNGGVVFDIYSGSTGIGAGPLKDGYLLETPVWIYEAGGILSAHYQDVAAGPYIDMGALLFFDPEDGTFIVRFASDANAYSQADPEYKPITFKIVSYQAPA